MKIKSLPRQAYIKTETVACCLRKLIARFTSFIIISLQAPFVNA